MENTTDDIDTVIADTMPPHMETLNGVADDVAAPALTIVPSERKRLTGADIRKKRDLVTEDVEIPEWDGWVTVKALSAKERDDFENSVLVKRGKVKEFQNTNIRAKLAVRTTINPDGTRVWTDDDAEWLGDKNASAVNRIYNVAGRLSGITDADADELEGNSKAAHGGDLSLQ